MNIRDMKGLGSKSEQELHRIGIKDAAALKAADPFVVYKMLKETNPATSLNFLYAIIGAIEDIPWQDVKKNRKTEILMRLDDLGIAPK